MQRTKLPTKLDRRLTALEQIAGEINARYKLSSYLGQQYGGDREVFKALGYKETLLYNDYSAYYARNDIAKAVIDRPVKVTWRGALQLVETNDDQQTKLEKAFTDMEKTLSLKSKFSRLDRLAGLGHYAVLLLGTSDVSTKEDFQKPLAKGTELLYVKPFSEVSAKIDAYEANPSDARYGKPLFYKVTVNDNNSQSEATLRVHHTRVIHVLDDTLESEVIGIPRLEVVFNRLMDLEKLVGGDAEMFWRGARPGYAGQVREGFQMTDQTITDLREQIDEFEHNLRRILVNEGVNLESLAQQIADPGSHVDVQIMMISAVTGIPKRILTGSERGELASSQDANEWYAYVQSRREEFAEPNIVRPFVDTCIEWGLLPAASEEGYTVRWDELFSISNKEKVEIGKARATAIKEYTTNPAAEELVPPEAFYRHILGLDDNEINLLMEQADQHLQEMEEEEDRLFEQEQEEERARQQQPTDIEEQEE